ncbi:MAG TPA: 1-deoxy-D-xylulose-5-phosphate reductoisomerase [Firmicutes bacterium]|jgi:1-deoxy-D-xylulose-5-phosphate reductoisomerase|nr:1-deoxy-D-xylulose-5-phosphate reductoisomerase [Bacillota bacterium]
MAKRISILGSTGSIGCQTLDVIKDYPEEFQVLALTGRKNVSLLAQQVKTFQPELAVLTDPEAARQLSRLLHGQTTRVLAGEEGLLAAATYPGTDLLVTAVVGFAGLKPTLAAIDAGIDIALANKETLVTAGSIVMQRARERKVDIIPIDSEHSAIFQCLQGNEPGDLQRIMLTASGGPFRNYSKEELAGVSPEQALKHPNWSMGAKITVDSATMMNKGLEVLEAHWLFPLPLTSIEVLVHPQSVVHSLIEFKDGSILAQLGPPDMRFPILYSLTYPKRWSNNLPKLDLVGRELAFTAPDLERFPCLAYAYEAGEKGGTMPTVVNAANEMAVAAFLQKKIGFLDIPRVIRQVMDLHQVRKNPDLDAIFSADTWARQETQGIIRTISGIS